MNTDPLTEFGSEAKPAVSAHTPGPWSVVFVIDGAFQIARDVEGDEIVIASRNEIPRLHDEFAANARLIAAAPDLLAALRDVLDGLDTYWAANNHETVAAAEAAIAKAEGRS
jgi:hypothetical protein